MERKEEQVGFNIYLPPSSVLKISMIAHLQHWEFIPHHISYLMLSDTDADRLRFMQGPHLNPTVSSFLRRGSFGAGNGRIHGLDSMTMAYGMICGVLVLVVYRDGAEEEDQRRY